MKKNPRPTKEVKRNFWNKRATMGFIAGTNDFNVAGMEIKKILDLIKPGSKILEVGSGNGILLVEWCV